LVGSSVLKTRFAVAARNSGSIPDGSNRAYSGRGRFVMRCRCGVGRAYWHVTCIGAIPDRRRIGASR
jgi:hypothetical protein